MLKNIRQRYLFLKKLNLIKSLYYSLRFGGRVLVGRAKFFIEGNGALEFSSPRSSLLVGVHTTVDTPAVVTIMHNAKLIIGSNSMIHRGCKIVVHSGGCLTIGNSTYINENARIHCRKHISIGDKCAIAWNTNILDTDIHTIYYADNKRTNNDADVVIGNNVWIGANSTVLKGTTIQDNCIVGANSVVKGTLNSQQIYSGNPAERKGSFVSWKI
jgi:acetyltransferase-like isoleucine patch superfamily enzyme